MILERKFRTTMYYLVDLDGTVALKHPDRGHYDWHLVGQDYPNMKVIRVVQALQMAGYLPVFITGRMEQCRSETLEWIHRHIFPMMKVSLLMRKDEDYRPDEIVKREIFEENFDKDDVLCVIDDRNKVVKMWREELGLTCLQCAEGDF